MSKSKKQLREINLILSDIDSGDGRIMKISPIKNYNSLYSLEMSDGQRCVAEVFLENEGVNYSWED